MWKIILRRHVAAILLILSVVTPVAAERLLVPQEGGVGVYEGSSLQLTDTLTTGSPGLPVLAVHPDRAVLATVAPGQELRFWNLPGLSEASRHPSELLRGVVGAAFALNGSELYLLNQDLRAIVVFRLQDSKFTGLIPIPGSRPQTVTAYGEGLWVGQEDGASFVSADLKIGLLAQYRFSERLEAGAVARDRFFTALGQGTGISAYKVSDGKGVAFLATQSRAKSLLAHPQKSALFWLGTDGRCIRRDLASAQNRWVTENFSGGEYLAVGSGETLYVLAGEAGRIWSLDAETGQPAASASSAKRLGQPVVLP